MNSMSDATHPPATGAHADAAADLSGKVCGDFRILRQLGQGGMGQVYLAEQVSLKRKVALKFLKPELAANKTSLERFQREAEAIARVTHANIVQIHAVGETEGRHFMALEYVEGRNLREFIEKKGPPDVAMGLRIIAQVGSALQQACELGIVHRDIKPENILINRRGEVKVTDFGLSRHFKKDSNLTDSRIAMGTPLYMSPEQVEGKPVDHRSDIYSFGVTCYHLFAGHPPFKGESPFEVALQHVNKEPAALCEIRPDLPADLCGLVHKMMAKRPEARYQTGREIVRDASRLRDALVATGGQLPATVLNGLTPTGTMVTIGNESTGVRTRSHPLRFLGMIVGVLALGLGIGWLATPRPVIPLSMPDGPPEGKGGEPPAAIKDLFGAAERDKDLPRRVQDVLKNPAEFGPNLDLIMDLGAVYLRDGQLDEADTLFKDLERVDRRVPQHRLIGHLGHAMTLALRDQPAESNQLFVKTFEQFDQADAAFPKLGRQLHLLVDKNVAWREQISRALDRNYANAPNVFPPRLLEYRKPPWPSAKAP